MKITRLVSSDLGNNLPSHRLLSLKKLDTFNSIFADQKDLNEWRYAMPPFGLLTKDQLKVLKEKVEDLGLDLSKRLS